MTVDEEKHLGYCRPRKLSNIKLVYEGIEYMHVGLKPTQRWHILGINNGIWMLKRHNVVIGMSLDEFLKYFYRTDK